MKSTVKKNIGDNRSIPLLATLVLIAIIAAFAAFAYVSKVGVRRTIPRTCI